MSLPREVRIWNRSALENGGSAARAGDHALAAMLLLHGMVMNGGIAHALESLSAEEYQSGVAAFRYFGLLRVASILERGSAKRDLGELEPQYGALVPDDTTLVQAFESRLHETPDAFAPIESENA
jgi:hypothetical protein